MTARKAVVLVCTKRMLKRSGRMASPRVPNEKRVIEIPSVQRSEAEERNTPDERRAKRSGNAH